MITYIMQIKVRDYDELYDLLFNAQSVQDFELIDSFSDDDEEKGNSNERAGMAGDTNLAGPS